MRRREASELMDRPDVDRDLLAAGLRDLERVNRWLGGKRTAVRLVMEIARRVPTRPVHVLDVGTGAADIPLALSAAMDREEIAHRIVATDLHPLTLDAARTATSGNPNIQVSRADARALPFEEEAFDIAMNNTMLHHCRGPEAVQVLRELERVARWGVVVTDLVRSWPALLGARALAATVWRRHPVTRHDGPASVRAAFTPRELQDLAAMSIAPSTVRTHPVFRQSLVIDHVAAQGG